MTPLRYCSAEALQRRTTERRLDNLNAELCGQAAKGAILGAARAPRACPTRSVLAARPLSRCISSSSRRAYETRASRVLRVRRSDGWRAGYDDEGAGGFSLCRRRRTSSMHLGTSEARPTLFPRSVQRPWCKLQRASRARTLSGAPAAANDVRRTEPRVADGVTP